MGRPRAQAAKQTELADEDLAAGHTGSAGDKKVRAGAYLITAKRLLGHGSEGRTALFEHIPLVFHEGLALSTAQAETVTIPTATAL